jgi:hypothetical protein
VSDPTRRTTTSTTATTTRTVVERPSRKKVAGWTALTGGLLFIGGWIEGLPRVENDLTAKAEAAATAAGFDVTAKFSGQDGTLRCAAALDDAGRATVLQLVKDIKGVRVAKFDASCVAPAAATPAATTTAAPTPSTTAAPETTVAPTTAAPEPTVAPTTVAPTTVAVVAAVPATKAEFAGGRIVLTGKVASDAA